MEGILMLHGLNHDKMGRGDQSSHGSITMEDLNKQLKVKAQALDLEIDFFQSNDEKQVIQKLEAVKNESYAGIIFNPGSWMEDGEEIARVLAKLDIPIIEIHMSNINKEKISRNVIAPSVTGLVTGFGEKVYLIGLEILSEDIRKGC